MQVKSTKQPCRLIQTLAILPSEWVICFAYWKVVEKRSQLEKFARSLSTGSDVVSIPANYTNALDGKYPHQ